MPASLSAPSKGSGRPATLADVGRAAGVSAMAASAVLNRAQTSARISSPTRARILAAAEHLHYRPNAAARALAERRMNTLGVAAVVVGGELDHYFLAVFNGVLDAAAKQGQNTTVFALANWDRDAVRLPELCDGRIDGLILIAPTFSKVVPRFLPEHTPFAALHPNIPIPGCVNIESAEEAGAFEMVRQMIARGHRRIMHISGNRGLLGAERRIQGYQRAHAAAGIPLDPALLIDGEFSWRSGRRVLRRWLSQSVGQPLPDAIFCCCDANAVGCLEALAEAGIRVPEDVSLVGFDDTLAARTTVPQLTTVRQPLRSMGVHAVEALLAQIQQKNGEAPPEVRETVIFPTETVWRASASAPAQVRRLVPAR